MQCLKCGKETKNEHVFCAQCLAVMDTYPVKPDVHIQLPKLTDREFPKKSGKKRRPPSLEEQIASLRRRNRRLGAALLIAVLLLGAAVYLLHRDNTPPVETDTGKNYTSTNPFD